MAASTGVSFLCLRLQGWSSLQASGPSFVPHTRILGTCCSRWGFLCTPLCRVQTGFPSIGFRVAFEDLDEKHWLLRRVLEGSNEPNAGQGTVHDRRRGWGRARGMPCSYYCSTVPAGSKILARHGFTGRPSAACILRTLLPITSWLGNRAKAV